MRKSVNLHFLPYSSVEWLWRKKHEKTTVSRTPGCSQNLCVGDHDGAVCFRENLLKNTQIIGSGQALHLESHCWICCCHGNASHVPLWYFFRRCPILIFHFFHTCFLSCSWLQNKSTPLVHLHPTDPGRERISCSSLSVFLGFRWTWEIAANNRIHGIHGSCEQNLSEATTALLAHQRDTFLEKLMDSHFPKKWFWNSKRRQEKTRTKKRSSGTNMRHTVGKARGDNQLPETAWGADMMYII